VSHPRKQIRDAVIGLLADIEAFEGRVTGYRVDPHYDLPSLVVSVADSNEGGDQVDPEKQYAGAMEVHSVAVICEVRAKEADGMDDALDDLCLAVEEMVETDLTLDGLLVSPGLELQGTVVEIEGSESDQECGLAVITWNADYRINRGARETII
jgi:hypothetical protein